MLITTSIVIIITIIVTVVTATIAYLHYLGIAMFYENCDDVNDIIKATALAIVENNGRGYCSSSIPIRDALSFISGRKLISISNNDNHSNIYITYSELPNIFFKDEFTCRTAIFDPMQPDYIDRVIMFIKDYNSVDHVLRHLG